ncbi:hypothetical protein Gpo141_00006995 [Globisporangium polare]
MPQQEQAQAQAPAAAAASPSALAPARVPEIDMPYDCDVYEPAEDTFVLLDALQDELPCITALEPAICLEIGCGSGAVFVYLANALRQLDGTRAMFFATDINPLAASVAQHTATINDVPAFDLVRTDLVSCYEQRLQGKVDVLLFNPPYVPTPSDEVGSTGIEAAWAGGLHGREVIDRLLPKLKDLLSPRGVFYMVVVVENKPKQIAAILAKDGFSMTVVRSTKAKNERLSILKFTRSGSRA